MESTSTRELIETDENTVTRGRWEQNVSNEKTTLAPNAAPLERGPLGGVRIVDMTTSYAGPTTTMYLADLGADVIKIERPGHGDDARGWGPPFLGELSVWFASANRNKRSLVLDLKSPEGVQTLHRLLDTAQVFIHNLNPSKIVGLGLDHERIRQLHPRLVYCAISGFGLDGPDAHLSGYDLIAQARSGIMSVTGETGRLPQRVSTALSDVATAMSACAAILAALRRLEHTGVGDVVEVSLLETDLALMAPRIASYLAGEPEPQPSGGSDSVLSIYQVFPTADRSIVIAVGNDIQWLRFCHCLNLADYAIDTRMRTNAGRRNLRSEIVGGIAKVLERESADYWLERLADAGVPASKVQGLSEVVSDPQVVARESIVTLATEDGMAYGVQSPWRLLSQGTLRHRPPPTIGDHTHEILAELNQPTDESVPVGSESNPVAS